LVPWDFFMMPKHKWDFFMIPKDKGGVGLIDATRVV